MDSSTQVLIGMRLMTTVQRRLCCFGLGVLGPQLPAQVRILGLELSQLLAQSADRRADLVEPGLQIAPLAEYAVDQIIAEG